MQGWGTKGRVWVEAALAIALGVSAEVATAKALDPLHELEVKVWTADEHELVGLEKEIVRVIQTQPDSALAHYLLSRELVRLFARDPGDLYTLKQASDLAQQAIDLEPLSDVGYIALADILDLMGNPDRGLMLLNEAESAGLSPSWRFYFTRARLTADSTKTENTLGLLETALAFVDAEPRIIVPYVVALLQSENTGEDLIAKLAHWNQRFPSPLFDLTTAITYSELGQHKKAHAIYAEIIKQHADNKEAKINDAILLYRDLKENVKAEALFHEVLTKHAPDLAPSSLAMVRAHLGAAYLAQKKPNVALDTFLDAVAVDPTNLATIDFVTRAYRNTKDHKGLVKLIRQLNDRVPGTGVLYALLGETLSEKLGAHDDALKAFADAITLDPERSDYYNGMGLTYYRQKSYPEALKLFVAASEVDPNDATARYNEACVLSLMGRSEEALSTLAEALNLDPRLIANARSDADFSNIKGNLKFMELVQQGGTDDIAH